MFEKIAEKFKQKFCEHSWVISWKRDYMKHMLGQDVRFYSLSSEPTVKICTKCGKVEDHIDVPTEEYFWADSYLVNANWDAYLENKNNANAE